MTKNPVIMEAEDAARVQFQREADFQRRRADLAEAAYHAAADRADRAEAKLADLIRRTTDTTADARWACDVPPGR